MTLLSNIKQIGRFLQNYVAFSEHLNFKNLKNCVWCVSKAYSSIETNLQNFESFWRTLALSFSSCSDISCWSRSSSEKVTFENRFSVSGEKKRLEQKKLVKLFHLKSPLKEIFRFRMYPDSHFRCLHRGPLGSCRWPFQAEKIEAKQILRFDQKTCRIVSFQSSYILRWPLKFDEASKSCLK